MGVTAFTPHNQHSGEDRHAAPRTR